MCGYFVISPLFGGLRLTPCGVQIRPFVVLGDIRGLEDLHLITGLRMALLMVTNERFSFGLTVAAPLRGVPLKTRTLTTRD